MNIKKSILTSLLLGTIYASSASAGLVCESFPNAMFCENTAPWASSNTYSWNTSGTLFIQSGGSSFISTIGCNAQGMGTVTSTVTFSNGTSQTFSQSKYCASSGGGYGNGGLGGGCSNPDSQSCT